MRFPDDLLTRTLLCLICTLALCVACGPPPPDSDNEPETASDRIPPTPVPIDDSATKDTAYFLSRYLNPDWLAAGPVTETMVMRSSQHPDRGISDFNSVQAVETIDGETWKVLFDETGPGVISRIWMSGNVDGTLRIELDDDDTPVLELPILHFFTGESEQFPYRFLYSSAQEAREFIVSSGSLTSYMPIPFRQRCRIMVQTDSNELFYQVNALRYPDSEEVVSFAPDFDQRTRTALRAANDRMLSIRYNQIPEADKRKNTVTIPPGEKIRIANLSGPAAIEFFDLKLSPFSEEVLRNTRLEIFWDTIASAAVSCTLNEFIAYAPADEAWSSYYMGLDPTQQMLFSSFYMPFKESAQVFLHNQNDVPLEIELSFLVDIINVPEEPLYFLVSANRREDLLLGVEYPRLNFEGSGRIVALGMDLESDAFEPPFFVLEGDENIYVDGESQPSLRGTGMDHLFNWVSYFMQTERFWAPLYGCFHYRVRQDNTLQATSYRWRVLDHIPFQQSLLIIQEMGDTNQFFENGRFLEEKARMNLTQYWYSTITEPQPISRTEHVFHYTINQATQGQPNYANPVFRGQNLKLHLPEGNWYVHLAPVWNIQEVQTIHNPIVLPATEEAADE